MSGGLFIGCRGDVSGQLLVSGQAQVDEALPAFGGDGVAEAPVPHIERLRVGAHHGGDGVVVSCVGDDLQMTAHEPHIAESYVSVKAYSYSPVAMSRA